MWWGFVAQVPCNTAYPSARVELRPRSLYYYLKASWKLGSVCVAHDVNASLAAPYDVAAYPDCGDLLIALAANMSAVLDGTASVFSQLPLISHLVDDGSAPPGSTDSARIARLNHTLWLLQQIGSPPASFTADHLLAMQQAADLLPANLTCLAAYAALDPLDHDGCALQEYASCMAVGICPARVVVNDDLNEAVLPTDMSVYVARQKANHGLVCAPAQPPQRPSYCSRHQPRAHLMTHRCHKAAARMVVRGRDYLDGVEWIMGDLLFAVTVWR